MKVKIIQDFIYNINKCSLEEKGNNFDPENLDPIIDQLRNELCDVTFLSSIYKNARIPKMVVKMDVKILLKKCRVSLLKLVTLTKNA